MQNKLNPSHRPLPTWVGVAIWCVVILASLAIVAAGCSRPKPTPAVLVKPENITSAAKDFIQDEHLEQIVPPKTIDRVIHQQGCPQGLVGAILSESHWDTASDYYANNWASHSYLVCVRPELFKKLEATK
jgi:hypothetical protein